MSLEQTIQPIEFTAENLGLCPKVPSLLGETTITQDGVTIHCAETTRFNPSLFIANPNRPVVPPQGDVLPMPISLLPSSSFIPKEYQVHLHSQICDCCKSLHEWSVVYAHNEITSRLGSGKNIKNLVPVDHFSYNVPVRLLKAPQRKVPSCHECSKTWLDLSDLPRPADTEEYKRVIAAFQSPGNLQTEETKKPQTASAAKKPAKSIDDFI